MMDLDEVTDYYMSEGCAIFAIALHRVFGYELGSYLDDDNEDFVDEEGDPLPGIIHVFTYVDDIGDFVIDVKGVRTLEEMKKDFFDVNGRIDWEISETEILENYAGGDDSRLYKIRKKDINEAIKFIKDNFDTYSVYV